MVRDFSHLNLGAAPPQTAPGYMEMLGWSPFFAQQTSIEDIAATPPVRVTSVHRSGAEATGEGLSVTLPPTLHVAVGDWVLYDPELPGDSRILERKSLMKRRAPGEDRRVQMIAANIDTALITTSCNADFNVARLERYLSLAFEAGVTPVIVLTKPDLTDPGPYIERAAAISPLVPVVAVNALSDAPRDKLAAWCKPGQTVAFVGSSGVGKSTLVNELSGSDLETRAIREDDARGRHTTTRREMFIIPGTCAVIDTPGMRELQLTDAAAGVAELFEDLETLSHACKFRDCAHQSEPGCAILAAIEAGEMDAARVARWQKLRAEDTFNSATLAERRAKDKAFGKMVRGVVKGNRK